MNEKPKIGVLSMPLSNNLGGMLQLMALCHVIDKMGFQVVWLDWKYPESLWKRSFKKILIATGWKGAKSWRIRQARSKVVRNFCEKHIRAQKQTVAHWKQLVKITEEVGLVGLVAGSDQIWRMEYMQEMWPASFLNFAPSTTRRIAYAASFGTDRWDYPDRSERITKWLSEFYSISVRESSGLELCKKIFSLDDAQWVLDPVLLGGSRFFDSLQWEHKDKYDPFGYAYFLDEEHTNLKILKRIAANYNLHWKSYNPDDVASQATTWIQEMAHCSFVVTDSYHGMLLALHFKKPFLVINNKKRGRSRFYSLLEALDLLRCIIEPQATSVPSAMELEIDYEQVQLKLERLQEQSSNFLTKALQGL